MTTQVHAVYRLRFPLPADTGAEAEIEISGDLDQVLAAIPLIEQRLPNAEYEARASRPPTPTQQPQDIGKQVPSCDRCGSTAVWREGTSQTTGKRYAFWKCLPCDTILKDKKGAA